MFFSLQQYLFSLSFRPYLFSYVVVLPIIFMVSKHRTPRKQVAGMVLTLYQLKEESTKRMKEGMHALLYIYSLWKDPRFKKTKKKKERTIYKFRNLCLYFLVMRGNCHCLLVKKQDSIGITWVVAWDHLATPKILRGIILELSMMGAY